MNRTFVQAGVEEWREDCRRIAEAIPTEASRVDFSSRDSAAREHQEASEPAHPLGDEPVE